MTTDSLRPVLFGALAAAGPLATFAGVLKEHTHHRQLGAVTFAFIALFVMILAVQAMRRALEQDSPRWVRAGACAMALLSGSVAILFSLGIGA